MKRPESQRKFEELKNEIQRLQTEFLDEGQFADPALWPKTSVDGPFNDKVPTGVKSVQEAMQESHAN
jgi:hypothetical protein